MYQSSDLVGPPNTSLYDDAGNVYVGKDEQTVRAQHELDANLTLRQDDDVLDTWFSSALWPFSTLGWPEQTDALKTFYPGSVLVTGFDIIFFWVARMIMFGTKFMDGEVPFRDVYIHGLVRDASGQKMSKSKGNVLDPLDIIDGIELEALVTKRTSNLMQDHKSSAIEKQTRQEFPDGIPGYGTDALRFTFASLASNGRDVRFDLKRVEGYRNFCNKLYNATRYVLMNTQDIEGGFNPDDVPEQRNTADNWIVSRLQETEAQVAEHINEYRFDLAANALYEFIWNEYCDWYVELAKPILNGDTSPAQKQATRVTLLRVLEATLRLAHPMMPFITEELWQQVAPLAGKSGPSISLQAYPISDASRIDQQALDDINWVKEVVMGVRRIRSEMNINPGKKLGVLVADASEQDLERLKKHESLLTSLARLESITKIDGNEAPESAIALVDQMRVLIPMAGLIDKDAELARLGKEVDRLEKEVTRLGAKLSNKGFTDKAPAAVVAGEQKKLDEAKSSLTQMQEQKDKIAAL